MIVQILQQCQSIVSDIFAWILKKVFMVTLSSQLGNGADTIVVLGALFADSMPTADFLIILTLPEMG